MKVISYLTPELHKYIVYASEDRQPVTLHYVFNIDPIKQHTELNVYQDGQYQHTMKLNAMLSFDKHNYAKSVKHFHQLYILQS